MTNPLPGNPHYSDAAKNRAQLTNEDTANEQYLAEVGITDETMQFSALNRLAEAQLAVAYEQRTANLIAVVSAHLEPARVRLSETEFEVLRSQLRDRLGLNDG